MSYSAMRLLVLRSPGQLLQRSPPAFVPTSVDRIVLLIIMAKVPYHTSSNRSHESSVHHAYGTSSIVTITYRTVGAVAELPPPQGR